jgi:hypothetical protein
MAGQIETIRSATSIIGRNGIGNGILPLIAVSLKFLAGRSSAGTAGAGVGVETGWRVKVTASMADRAAPAVVQPRLVRLLDYSK